MPEIQASGRLDGEDVRGDWSAHAKLQLTDPIRLCGTF